MVVVAPNNGTSGNELPPPRIPRHMEHDEYAASDPIQYHDVVI